jgi:hypothetical protein
MLVIEGDDDLIPKFIRLVKHKQDGDFHEYTCPKGLWVVRGPNREYAYTSAMHYFYQYESDGEYDTL